MKTKLFFILLLPACLSNPVHAQQTKEDSLQTAVSNARDDTAKRHRLDELYYFYLKDGLERGKETVAKLQFLLQKKENSKLSYRLPIYRVYLTHTIDSIVETRKYIYEFLEQCRRLDDKEGYVGGLMGLALKEIDVGNYNDALRLLLQSLDYARDTLKNLETISGVYTLLGIFYADQRDTIRALVYYKKALETSVENGNINSIGAACNNLAMVYKDMMQYDSAKIYYRKSISMYQQSDIGGDLYKPVINLAEVFRITHEYDSAFFYSRESIRIAIASNNGFLDAGYWIMAQTFRDFGKPDSAMIYYTLAKEEIEKRQLASSLRDFYPDLAGFYASLGNHKSAYEYLQKATGIKDSLYSSENNKVLKEMDAKYEASSKEKELLKQEEQIKRQRILNYSVIAIAVFFLLLIFFIYRSYRLKKKSNIILEEKNTIITNEKKRSDDLLLNILPSEVAEELKQKGTADAKQFDDVTVMFTDFKNFTEISEKLSPAELVAEIHTCFKSFDNIITRHNIEKIKTIGDSYMCAGGLPLANKTNATDVVSAALEIQQFIHQHLQQRRNEGKEPFEIRIGVHSGPVVAGIVGVKKFAYDIWGDTVNIASRMESSGEAGKVNISGSTYELVKDKFNCIHRGKIQAKNKGEIDMYFVEHPT